MNLQNWTRFYKYNNLNRADQNSVYVPYVSPDKKTFCMDYSNSSEFFFDNEVRWLEHLQNETYAPELIDIDKTHKYITFEWYDSSVNHLMFDHKFIQIEQAQSTLAALEKQNIIKLNYFPHTCYIDNNNNFRIHDLYACASVNNSQIPFDKIEHSLSDITKFYYQQHVNNGIVDLKRVHASMIAKNQGDWPQCLKTTLVMY